MVSSSTRRVSRRNVHSLPLILWASFQQHAFLRHHSAAAPATSSLHLTCDLECANGGYCTMISEKDEELIAAGLNGRLVQRCVCHPGYTGITCSEQLDECVHNPDSSSSKPKCHNGAPCTLTHGVDGTEEYTCDCNAAQAMSRFAGYMCRKPATEYCGDGIRTARSFCTNGGTCNSNLGEKSKLLLRGYRDVKEGGGMTDAPNTFQHLGCRCPPEFEGDHCEFLIGTRPKQSSTPKPTSKPTEPPPPVEPETEPPILSSANDQETTEKSTSSSSSGRSIVKIVVGISVALIALIGLYGVIYNIKRRQKRALFWRTVDLFLVADDHDLGLNRDTSPEPAAEALAALQQTRLARQEREEREELDRMTGFDNDDDSCASEITVARSNNRKLV